MNSSQDQSFTQIAAPVVTDVLNGFNGVIMAYGQTGSGKTHTIFGSKGDLNNVGEDPRLLGKGEDKKMAGSKYQFGIVPRAVQNIFNYIEQNPNQAVFRVTISFLEVYMEIITDLLLTPDSKGGNTRDTSGNRSHSALRNASTTSLNANQKLQIREDPKTGIFVHGLTQIHVKTMQQLIMYV